MDEAGATSRTGDYAIRQEGCGFRGAGGQIENLGTEAAAFDVTVVFRKADGGLNGTANARTGTIQPGKTGDYSVAAPTGMTGVPATCVVRATRVVAAQAASPSEIGTVNFVALANKSRVFVSNDGKKWRVLETKGVGYGALLDVAYHDGLWVAVSDDKKIVTSRNGIDWDVVFTDTVRSSAIRVFYEQGRWVAMPRGTDSGHRPVYSVDGVTWEPGGWDGYKGDGSNPPVLAGQGAVHPSGRQFAIDAVKTLVSRQGSGVYRPVGEPTDKTKPRFVTSVGYADGILLVTGGDTDRELATSTDGVTWTFPGGTKRPDGSRGSMPFLEDQAYADGTWVVVASTGAAVFVSTDRAATWEAANYKEGNDPGALGDVDFHRVAGTG